MVRVFSTKQTELSEWIPVSLVHNGRQLVLIEHRVNEDQTVSQPNKKRRSCEEGTEEECTGETILYKGIDNDLYGCW